MDRYNKKVAAIARRALALAQAHFDTPEAPEALVWVTAVGLGSKTMRAERDAAYDLLAQRYLDSDELVHVLAAIWVDHTAPTGAFLRAALERSSNPKVRGLACFDLGRYDEELLDLVRNLNDTIRSKILEKRLDTEHVQWLRTLQPEQLRRDAEAYFERTLKEFAEIRLAGKEFPSLGENTKGALFRLRHLKVGSTVPDYDGEDLNGQPMKLSDFRGKVVVISFWATWCGPCMELVPHEKELVERMKGRPFVLIGVNGDEDREQAKRAVAKEGINWRSFWEGGRKGGIAVEWSVLSWPTVYVVDAQGRIRDDGMLYFHELYGGSDPNKTIEDLVVETEAAAKKP